MEAGQRRINRSRLWAMTGSEGQGVFSGSNYVAYVWRVSGQGLRAETVILTKGHENWNQRHLRRGAGVGKEPNVCFVAKLPDPSKGSRTKAASPAASKNGLLFIKTSLATGSWEVQGCWHGVPLPPPPHSRLPTAFAPGLSSISRG